MQGWSRPVSRFRPWREVVIEHFVDQDARSDGWFVDRRFVRPLQLDQTIAVIERGTHWTQQPHGCIDAVMCAKRGEPIRVGDVRRVKWNQHQRLRHTDGFRREIEITRPANSPVHQVDDHLRVVRDFDELQVAC